MCSVCHVMVNVDDLYEQQAADMETKLHTLPLGTVCRPCHCFYIVVAARKKTCNHGRQSSVMGSSPPTQGNVYSRHCWNP